MVEAGIPLGPTMAFLIAAPMINVPAVFMTACILGWKLAIGRILGTFFIALTVGQIISYIQKKERFLKRLIKINAIPSLSKELQEFATQVVKKLVLNPDGLLTDELAKGEKEKLFLLGEAGILDRNKKNNKWILPASNNISMNVTNACFVLPSGDKNLTFIQRIRNVKSTAWDFFLQFNYYLILAVLIGGAIKVLIPTNVVVNWVGGENLNSVLISSIIPVLAYVCTYVEVPTALALIQKGMGGGATLAYLLGGPGLSLPSIVMLSGIFKQKILWIYVFGSFAGCVLVGYIFNLF